MSEAMGMTPPRVPEESLLQIRQDLRQEMDMRVQIMAQQMRHEQAASTIQLSQITTTQMQQMAEEIKRANMASHEKDIRQEKLMQMILQAQNSPERAQDPRARSMTSPPPKNIMTCHCGKPAEALVVKKDGPRKGRMFWKCVRATSSCGSTRRTRRTSRMPRPRLHPEPKAVQESKAGGLCGAGAGGIGALHKLVEGVGLKQQGTGGGSDSNPGRLNEDEAQATRAQCGRDPYFHVEKVYWLRQPGGNWSEEEGKIPTEASEVYVQLKSSRRKNFQEHWEENKSTQLSRKNRQMLTKAMKQAEEKFKNQDGVSISEVYSPPRIAPHLEKRGWRVGSSFDLLTGWDLADPKQRLQMWRALRILREERPRVIIACPPCTAFSQLQAINFGRMDADKKIHMLQIGREHVAVLRWQLRRGGAVLFEHPDGASSWQDPELQSLATHAGVRSVVCDQCMFGLNVDGTGLNRKRTRWLSNMPPVLKALDVKCDSSHTHTVLMGGKPRLAQVYPQKLCEVISKAIGEYLNGNDLGCYVMEDEEEEDADDDAAEVQEGADGNYEPTEEEKRAVMKVHKAVGHPQNREFVRFLRAARVRGELVQWAAKSRATSAKRSSIQKFQGRPRSLGLISPIKCWTLTSSTFRHLVMVNRPTPSSTCSTGEQTTRCARSWLERIPRKCGRHSWALGPEPLATRKSLLVTPAGNSWGTSSRRPQLRAS